MIRIAITRAAYDAICATLPLGSTGYENAIDERGNRLIWLRAPVARQAELLSPARRGLQRRHPAGGGGKHAP